MAGTLPDEVWTFHTAETFCNYTIIEKEHVGVPWQLFQYCMLLAMTYIPQQ
jgi:hypothetical protein